MTKINNKRMRAFTAYELIISAALSLLVAAMATTLTVTVISYFNRTIARAEKSNTYISIKRSADLWFSYFDNEDFIISVENGETVGGEAVGVGKTVLASAKNKNSAEQYFITFLQQNSENDAQLIFEFPESSPYNGSVVIECKNLIGADISSIEWQNNQNESSVCFVISTKISGGMYRLDLTY